MALQHPVNRTLRLSKFFCQVRNPFRACGKQGIDITLRYSVTSYEVLLTVLAIPTLMTILAPLLYDVIGATVKADFLPLKSFFT